MAKNLALIFAITVLVAFEDKENPGKILNPGDTLKTGDLQRVNDIVRRGYGEIQAVEQPESAANVTQQEAKPKTPVVSVLGTEYDLAKVKEALKAIDVRVAANAGAENVAKKITELTDEQVQNLSAKLSE